MFQNQCRRKHQSIKDILNQLERRILVRAKSGEKSPQKLEY